MKTQNKITNNNSNGNLNHGMNGSNKGIHKKSQSADKFQDNNDLKGFNDYVLESFVNKNSQIRDKN